MLYKKLTFALIEERLRILQTLYCAYPKEHLNRGVSYRVFARVDSFFNKVYDAGLFQNLITPTINCDLENRYIDVQFEKMASTGKEIATFYFYDSSRIELELIINSLNLKTVSEFNLDIDFPENATQCLKYFVLPTKTVAPLLDEP